jgi:regulator of cell morphogenesis and NO signaling
MITNAWTDCLPSSEARSGLTSPAPQKRSASLQRGLKRHIRWEEEVLFSAFETDDENRTSGPTVVMRAEHRKIEEALQRLDDCVRDGNPDSDEDDARLLEILQAHNFKEERVVYPLVDRMLGAAEKEALLHRIHALASS